MLNLQMCKNSEFSWSAAILTRRFKVISCLSPICQYLLEQNDHWGPAVQVLIIKLRKQRLTSVPVSQSVVTVKPRDSETGNGNQPSRFFHRLGFSLKKRPYFRLKSFRILGKYWSCEHYLHSCLNMIIERWEIRIQTFVKASVVMIMNLFL